MICEFCGSTMEERKIYGVFVEGNLITTCSRCYPVKDTDQKTIQEFLE